MLVRAEFDEGCIFTIKEVPTSAMKEFFASDAKANGSRLKPGFRRKRKQKDSNPGGVASVIEFSEWLTKQAVIDWEGVTNNILLDVVDPRKLGEIEFATDKDGKKSRETAIDFDSDKGRELLDMIAKHPSDTFSAFLNNVVSAIPEMYRLEKEKELGN